MAINFNVDITMHDPASYGNPEEFSTGMHIPGADVLGNYFNNEDERNHGRGKAALGAFMAVGMLAGVAGGIHGSGERINEQQVATYSNIPDSESDTTVSKSLDTSTSSSSTSTSEAPTTTEKKVEQLGAIGEAPCGPKVDPAEVLTRFNNNTIVIKPVETAKFFDANPEVEKAKSDMYASNYKGAAKWSIDNLPVVNPSILKTDGTENSLARQLMARMQAAVLEDQVEVQNHECNVTIDAAGNKVASIDPVNNITVLQKGEQVWALEFTQKDLDKMKTDGVEIPENLVMINPVDREATDAEGIAAAIAAERIACNNPLLDREHPPETTTVPPTKPKTPTTPQPTVPQTTPPTVPPTTPPTVPPTTPPTVPPTTFVPPKEQQPPVTGGPSTTVEKPKPSPSNPTTSTTKAPGTIIPNTTTTRAGNGTTTTSAPGPYHPSTTNGNQ